MNAHPLVTTLKNLKGNARAIVLTEPVFGIPYNLFIPYASVYMLALGMTDVQIGSITSIGLIFQVLFAMVGGVITDKLGRKRTTFIFDFISWTIPCIIWATAQDYRYFLAAIILNSAFRIPSISWACLLVEDTPSDWLVHIFSWIYIAGLISAFFAPIAGIFIHQYGLIPSVRGLYAFAALMLTAKFILLNANVSETTRGRQRMLETRTQPLLAAFKEFPEVMSLILHTPATLRVLGLMVILNIVNMVDGTFWSILVTQHLKIPNQNLAVFAFVRSIVLLVLYFTLVPRISAFHFRRPFLMGLVAFWASQILLITMPAANYPLLILSLVLEAVALASITPLLDSITALSINPDERARIMSLLSVVVILFTAPFGWIAGQLSEINRILPFALNLVLFVIGAVLIALTTRRDEQAEFKV